MTVYNYTGGDQTYVVPAGVNYIRATTKGAQGRDDNNVAVGGGIGGRGTIVTSLHQVTPGETLYVVAGQKPDASFNNVPVDNQAYYRNAYGFGGAVYRYRSGYAYGNEGGGCSAIRRGGNGHGNSIVIGGGGGGKAQDDAGSNADGGDAGPVGGTAWSGNAWWGNGAGATQTAGGAAGAGNYADNRTAGQWGYGGTGGWTGNFFPGGGGGGGGSYGGGGGAADTNGTISGGGGGGSSWLIPGAVLLSQGYAASGNTGHGQVTIDPYVPTTPVVGFPVAPQVAPRYAFSVDLVDNFNVPGGSRTITYQISKDASFATGVTTRTVTFVSNGVDGKIASDPAIPSAANSTTMFFWVPLLDAGTWYVRAKSGTTGTANDSAYTANSTFTVLAYVPPTPTLAYPVSPTTNRRFAFSVDVRALHPLAGGTQSITYDLSQTADFSAGVTSKTVVFAANAADAAVAGDPAIAAVGSGTVMNFWVTLPSQGMWYLRARVTGNLGLATTAYVSTSFTSSHVPAVTIISPTGSAYLLYAANTAFRANITDPWAADTITAYQIIIERNDTGAQIIDTTKMPLAVAAVLGQNTFNVAVPTTARDLLLRWKIRVWDSTDTPSLYSDYSLFTLVNPATVTITYPADGGTTDTGAPTFTWTVALTAGRTVTSSTITVREQATNSLIWQRTVGAGVLSVIPETTILVNQVGYVVTVDVIDSAALPATDSNLFTTSYISPDPILYTVDASLINDETAGYVEVNWSNQAPDTRLIAWRVYRRTLPSNTWELQIEIPDEGIKYWRDYLVQSGKSYMYTVSQLADRSGAILESPVGTRNTVSGNVAESQINLLLIDNYWLLVPDDPELSMLCPNVKAAGETEEWDSAVYNVVTRGRHIDYGDRLGWSGTLEMHIKQPERAAQARIQLEALRAAQETYYLRTPFGRLYKVGLGNPGWAPEAGTGVMEMGTLSIPYLEVG